MSLERKVQESADSKPDKKRYKIFFSCTLPVEHGNNFCAEHEFEGTYSEAEAEAEKISIDAYHGNFRHWILEAKTDEAPAEGYTMTKNMAIAISQAQDQGHAFLSTGNYGSYNSYFFEDGKLRCYEYISAADGLPYDSYDVEDDSDQFC